MASLRQCQPNVTVFLGETQAMHLVAEAGTGQSEDFGGLAAVPVAALKGLANGLKLDLRHAIAKPNCWRRTLLDQRSHDRVRGFRRRGTWTLRAPRSGSSTGLMKSSTR